MTAPSQWCLFLCREKRPVCSLGYLQRHHKHLLNRNMQPECRDPFYTQLSPLCPPTSSCVDEAVTIRPESPVAQR